MLKKFWAKSERKRPLMCRWEHCTGISVKGVKYVGDEFNWPIVKNFEVS